MNQSDPLRALVYTVLIAVTLDAFVRKEESLIAGLLKSLGWGRA